MKRTNVEIVVEESAVKEEKKKAKKEGLTNITTILSDRDINLPDESVDIILLIDTLHMIKDKQSLLKSRSWPLQVADFD